MAVPLSFHGGFWIFRVLFFLLFSSFFVFDVQCCVSNGGFFQYLLSTLVLMIPVARELVGIVLHSFFCALAMLWGTLIDSTVCILLNQVLSTIKMRRYEMLVHVWDEECRASVRKRMGNEDTCEIMRYG